MNHLQTIISLHFYCDRLLAFRLCCRESSCKWFYVLSHSFVFFDLFNCTCTLNEFLDSRHWVGNSSNQFFTSLHLNRGNYSLSPSFKFSFVNRDKIGGRRDVAKIDERHFFSKKWSQKLSWAVKRDEMKFAFHWHWKTLFLVFAIDVADMCCYRSSPCLLSLRRRFHTHSVASQQVQLNRSKVKEIVMIMTLLETGNRC